MYYLKYRPKTLSELDNTKAKKLLSSILNSEKLPHAFLFTGDRGSGKTSAGRILAKAVNCLNNKLSQKNTSIDPCNNCKSCLLIEKTASPDVLELDAASNRGIEEIKNLIKESFFNPMTGKYRVFIIDEAHMITQDAFNALLKTLEEPSEKVIFILATTNPEKIPITIRSRCIIVNFSPVEEKDVIHMLKRICKAENLKFDEKTLQLIAKAGDKSFRDSAKILEELVLLKIFEYEKVKEHLGVKGEKELLEILFTEDQEKALEWIEKFYENGGDVKTLLTNLLKSLKEKLIQAVKEKKKEKIIKIALLIKLLQQAYSELRITPLEIIPLEVAIISFYNRNYDKSI